MNDNIKKILQMVEEGKLDSSKASEIIEELNKKDNSAEQQIASKNKSLRIKIIKSNGEDVNINFPLKFIKSSIKAFGKLPVSISGNINGTDDIDTKAILDAIDNNIEGTIMDLKTGKGENVKIVIE
ncbi:MAG: hypothetical protein WAT71_16545 [Ignavibacteria bacterium]